MLKKNKTILQLIIQFTVKKFKVFLFFKQLTNSISRITQIQSLDLFKSKEIVCEIYQSYYPSCSYYSYRFQSQSVHALLHKAEYVFYSCSGFRFYRIFRFLLIGQRFSSISFLVNFIFKFILFNYFLLIFTSISTVCI